MNHTPLNELPAERQPGIGHNGDALVPIPEAGEKLPVPKTRATMRRWLITHPGLGVRIGGRLYVWQGALDAIAAGTPLAEAATLHGADRGRRAA